MKLLLDEQISGKVAEALRERKHDVMAVAEESPLRGLGDHELFELAQGEGRALVTFQRRRFRTDRTRIRSDGAPSSWARADQLEAIQKSRLRRPHRRLGSAFGRSPRDEGFFVWLQPPGY